MLAPRRMQKFQFASGKKTWQQKGDYERLLCGSCEHDFNDRFERPFIEYWRKNFPHHMSDPRVTWLPAPRLDNPRHRILANERMGGLPVVRLTDVPVRVFRLFHLSVLWRAHVAQSPSFANVRLGDQHANRIKQVLISEQLNSATTYVVRAFGYFDAPTRDIVHSVVMAPSVNRAGPARQYKFVYGGCAWQYTVASHTVPKFQIDLQESGEMYIPLINFLEDSHMRDLMVALGES